MTDAASDHRDRIRPVTSLRFDDLDWVVGELTRMRERGSRAFLVSAEPAGGIPPMHPDFDKVWAAATDLGMIAHLHVGMNPGLFHPAWANTDDPAIIRLISLQNPHHSAQVFLTAVVFGGVFERHPNLTVLVSELGIDWFPGWVNKVDSMAAPGVSPLVVGDYRWPLTPREYVRAQRAHLADPGRARVAAGAHGAGARRGGVLVRLPALRGQPESARVLRPGARAARRCCRARSSSAAASPSPTPAWATRVLSEGPR